MLARLRAHRDRHPDRLAVANGKSTRDLRALTRDAEALARRMRPGALVAAVLPSGPGFTAAQLACLEAGAVFFPLPLRATAAEHAKALAALAPDAVLVRPADAAPIRDALAALGQDAPLHDPDAPDDAPLAPRRAPALPPEATMVQLTSGSTGTPKPVVLGRAALEAAVDACADFAAAFAGHAVFSPMPQFHAMGGAVVLEHLLAGSSVLVANRFVPGDDRKRMQRAEVRALVGSPSYFRMLLRLQMSKGDALPALRACVLGSASVDGALLAGLREASPALSLHLRYGLSEAFGPLTRLDVAPEDALPPRGCVGAPLAGVELDVPADPEAPDEVRARAPSVALGLWREGALQPLADREGWLGTGDVGFRDAAGLHLRGRRSQFIKRQGYRIDPGEIEEALVSHPGVADAVVVGVPDPMAGQRIVAAVEAREAPETKALLAWCRSRLAPYKVPQKIERVEALPRTRSGKPDRAAVRAAMQPASQSPTEPQRREQER